MKWRLGEISVGQCIVYQAMEKYFQRNAAHQVLNAPEEQPTAVNNPA